MSAVRFFLFSLSKLILSCFLFVHLQALFLPISLFLYECAIAPGLWIRGTKWIYPLV